MHFSYVCSIFPLQLFITWPTKKFWQNCPLFYRCLMMKIFGKFYFNFKQSIQNYFQRCAGWHLLISHATNWFVLDVNGNQWCVRCLATISFKMKFQLNLNRNNIVTGVFKDYFENISWFSHRGISKSVVWHIQWSISKINQQINNVIILEIDECWLMSDTIIDSIAYASKVRLQSVIIWFTSLMQERKKKSERGLNKWIFTRTELLVRK